MTKLISAVVLCLSLLILPNISQAASTSPVGLWTTVDDKTNKPRSLIRITERKGVLYGRIQKVFKRPGDTGFCKKCPGKFKDKPVKGLQNMWGLKKRGEHTWDGGRILDPKNGKIYRAKITVAPNGKSLQLRGYVGVSLLGRTQTWYRRR